jgi:hypothetical protein
MVFGTNSIIYWLAVLAKEPQRRQAFEEHQRALEVRLEK